MLKTDRYLVRKILGEIVIFDVYNKRSVRLVDAQTKRFKREHQTFAMKTGWDRPLHSMIDKLCDHFVKENKDFKHTITATK